MFAFKDCPKDKMPVILEIVFKGSQGLFELTEGYSAYPDEQEVLVQDGLAYLVIQKLQLTDPETDLKYNLIKL